MVYEISKHGGLIPIRGSDDSPAMQHIIKKDKRAERREQRDGFKYEFLNAIRHNELLVEFSKCCICDWDRAGIDMAHKLSVIDGGEHKFGSIYPLCPNHHRMLDRGVLNEIEELKLEEFDELVEHKVAESRKKNIRLSGA